MARTFFGPSAIHGVGLFAVKPIRAGETILEWSECSQVLSEEQVAALSPGELRYVSFIEGRSILFEPPARFVNHSCDPNARGSSGRDSALRDIAAGEEITVDYVQEQVPGLDLECHCGSPKCRGNLKVPSR